MVWAKQGGMRGTATYRRDVDQVVGGKIFEVMQPRYQRSRWGGVGGRGGTAVSEVSPLSPPGQETWRGQIRQEARQCASVHGTCA